VNGLLPFRLPLTTDVDFQKHHSAEERLKTTRILLHAIELHKLLPILDTCPAKATLFLARPYASLLYCSCSTGAAKKEPLTSGKRLDDSQLNATAVISGVFYG